MATQRGSDVYGGLLQGLQSLRPEINVSRELWFAGLALADKREVVFELETLLKGLVRFGKRDAQPNSNYHNETLVVREALIRSSALIKLLLGNRDRERRLTERAQPAEMYSDRPGEPGRDIAASSNQKTPEGSLIALRLAFASYLDLAEALSSLPHVEERQFNSLHHIILLEVERNVYFQPLADFEFRGELDEIEYPEVLAVLERLESETVQRFAAFYFLTLTRALRTIELAQRYIAGGPKSLAYCVLSLLHNDLRSLEHYLERREGATLARSIEHEILSFRASGLGSDGAYLKALMPILASLKDMLHSTIYRLGDETTRRYDREMPNLEEWMKSDDQNMIARVKAQLEQIYAECAVSIHMLCLSLGATRVPIEEAKKYLTRLLFRETHMLLIVIKAGLIKAERCDEPYAPHVWSEQSSLVFAADLKQHLRYLGHRVLASIGYKRYHALITLLGKRPVTERDANLLLKDITAEVRALKDMLEAYLETSAQGIDTTQRARIRSEALSALRFYMQQASSKLMIPPAARVAV